jgi:bifunctional DNase/RNase
MIEVELSGVRVEMPSNTPLVVLKERDAPHRELSIFIGAPEATAIAFALEEVETPRPLTHDLIVDVLGDLGAELVRVEVTELQDSTFFAELHIEVGSESHTVSSRPSDAIALAVRTGAPLFVADEVMDEAAQVVEPPTSEPIDNPDEVVAEFRQFIDNVDPEDFAS